MQVVSNNAIKNFRDREKKKPADLQLAFYYAWVGLSASVGDGSGFPLIVFEFALFLNCQFWFFTFFFSSFIFACHGILLSHMKYIIIIAQLCVKSHGNGIIMYQCLRALM